MCLVASPASPLSTACIPGNRCWDAVSTTRVAHAHAHARIQILLLLPTTANCSIQNSCPPEAGKDRNFDRWSRVGRAVPLACRPRSPRMRRLPRPPRSPRARRLPSTPRSPGRLSRERLGRTPQARRPPRRSTADTRRSRSTSRCRSRRARPSASWSLRRALLTPEGEASQLYRSFKRMLRAARGPTAGEKAKAAGKLNSVLLLLHLLFFLLFLPQARPPRCTLARRRTLAVARSSSRRWGRRGG